MELLTYWLPDHWASALFNDDPSGLENEDLEQLEAFMKYHDAQPYGVLAAMCLPYVFPAPVAGGANG